MTKKKFKDLAIGAVFKSPGGAGNLRKVNNRPAVPPAVLTAHITELLDLVLETNQHQPDSPEWKELCNAEWETVVEPDECLQVGDASSCHLDAEVEVVQ